jgi:hypothetical protein
VINKLTPKQTRGNIQTRDKLVHYLGEVRQKLDNEIPLSSIPSFTEGQVLICGGLFPADQYPTQETIDRLTPEPMKGRGLGSNPWRLEEIAAYFKEVKAKMDGGGEIYDVLLNWPLDMKGDIIVNDVP